MNISVIGSRTFNDYEYLYDTMDFIAGENKWEIDFFISGGAKGADSLGEKWAKSHAIKIKIFYPDWDKYGRSAGYLRNIDIVENSDLIVAFWDGESKGTKHSIDLANKLKRKVIIKNYLIK